MRASTPLIALLPLLALAACHTSPPRPPAVDETGRRPANAALAVEAMACRTDLHNARLAALDATEAAQRARTSLAGITASVQALAAMPAALPPRGNSIYTVRFAFGSAHVDLAGQTAKALVEEARSAPLVLLRGRTDGAADTAAEARMARDRAVAMRDFLVAAGIEPSRIRVTYQPSGDHVAGNDGASGQALNRRVEVEIYRALPVPTGWTASAD